MMNWFGVFKKLNFFKRKKPKLPKQALFLVQEEEDHDESVTSEEKVNFSERVVKHVMQQGLARTVSVVCSPVSIDVTLSVLASGADNATLDQLLKLLGYAGVEEVNASARKLVVVLDGSEDDKGAPVVSFVNALWLDHRRFSFKDSFRKVLRDVHKAEAKALAVGSNNKVDVDELVKEANSWAEKETRGLIKQVLTRENINDRTVFLLANALYFKGTWFNSFKPEYTDHGYFNLNNGDQVRVSFMNKWSTHFDYGTFEDCQVLMMPYKRSRTKKFSMYFFLPFENDGLADILEKIEIDADSFKDQIKLDRVEITHLSIPKFKIECNVDLKEPMRQLGLTLPFEESCNDFSGILDVSAAGSGSDSDPDTLYVSNIHQKCCVEADERGTEAAVVTTYQCASPGYSPGSPAPTVNFVADHPFLFMIREDVSGAVLFVGTMLDPR